MKKILLIMTIFCLSLSAQAQNKNAKAELEVDGICEMCKVRIERAALDSKGVKYALWNPDTHLLSVIYNERKTDLESIHKSVAAAGHDTKEVTATDEAYESLDPCCLYRDPAVVEQH